MKTMPAITNLPMSLHCMCRDNINMWIHKPQDLAANVMEYPCCMINVYDIIMIKSWIVLFYKKIRHLFVHVHVFHSAYYDNDKSCVAFKDVFGIIYFSECEIGVEPRIDLYIIAKYFLSRAQRPIWM